MTLLTEKMNVGKCLHVNFGFKLLDEGCKAWSCEGNHCLAIWQPEKYEAKSIQFSVFPSIPLTNVIIDNLHLFLCVSVVLIRLLITELSQTTACY